MRENDRGLVRARKHSVAERGQENRENSLHEADAVIVGKMNRLRQIIQVERPGVRLPVVPWARSRGDGLIRVRCCFRRFELGDLLADSFNHGQKFLLMTREEVLAVASLSARLRFP